MYRELFQILNYASLFSTPCYGFSPCLLNILGMHLPLAVVVGFPQIHVEALNHNTAISGDGARSKLSAIRSKEWVPDLEPLMSL